MAIILALFTSILTISPSIPMHLTRPAPATSRKAPLMGKASQPYEPLAMYNVPSTLLKPRLIELENKWSGSQKL